MRFFLHFLGWWLVGSACGLDLTKPDQARTELASLVDEWESAYQASAVPENAIGLGLSLHALGIIERQLALPELAEGHLRRACELLEPHSEELVIDAREALALTLQDRGQLDESESLLRDVQAFRRKGNPDPIALALTLDHLGLSLLMQGRYAEVSPLLDESLSLLPESRAADRARVLSHLGRLHHTLGSHGRAIERFDEALALEFDAPELRLSLRSQKALAQLRLGKTAAAVGETEQVAEDARRILADTPIRAVPYINNLGSLSLALGNPSEAVHAFHEARDFVLENLGSDHPALAGIHHNLGVALQQLGSLEKAQVELEAARRLQRLHLPDVHLRVAETQKSLAVNAILGDMPDPGAAATVATQGALQLLERLVESGSETERLNFIERFDLLSLPCALGDADLIANTLLASKARLLDALMGARQPDPPTWQDLSSSLPPNSAFVDFCRYRPVRSDEPDQYGAILIVAGDHPKWIKLASSPDLHRWLGAFKQRLDWNAAQLGGQDLPPPPLTMQGVLGFLHQQFWAPIDECIPPETRHLAVSLDGAAHFLPLPALIGGDNQLLCHRFDQVCRVASGRDLLNQSRVPRIDGAPWRVLTISDYPRSEATEYRQTRLDETLKELGPLPGTMEESKAIRRVAPRSSHFRHDDQVTESSISELTESPGVLHFGGHAFFVGAPREDMPVDFDQEPDHLLASGLVLHRGLQSVPAVPGENPSDDLLFPAEIADLPLQSTRLVTLSSCESGLGTSVDGEGVLGLQRAFSLAGAREVMVALWPVSDRSTPDFMRRFYELAVYSDRTAQSLWQTQAEHLPDADDPGFEQAVLRYAPFCLTQSHSLQVGPPIELKRRTSSVWRWIPAPILVILGLFAWRTRRLRRRA